jgi:MFS family permease
MRTATRGAATDAPATTPPLSPNVLRLGLTSLLTAMSSSMVYSLLPVFLVRILGASTASVGLIEGLAEATTSFIKLFSGIASDWIGRRKPLVIVGYALSAINKLLFPLAGATSIILIARVVDRIGKGIRDAPRDAMLTDLMPSPVRGRGFGMRLAFSTVGFVLGPLAAIGLMHLSGDDFRLVFWIAVIPGALSILVLVVGVTELASKQDGGAQRLPIRRNDIRLMPETFWHAVMTASLLSLARLSPAFLVLKAHDIGTDAAFVPMMLVVMHLVYSIAVYPFGILADHTDRRLQLGIGILVLICADLVLAIASTMWAAAFGAALWGLQMGVTQGLLAATVADAAPDHLRGTAFGLYEIAIGITAFAASAGGGALWTGGGAAAGYGVSAIVAAVAALTLLRWPLVTAARGIP